jgi:hypothetical protein
MPREDEAGVLKALLGQPHDQLVELVDGTADERAVWLLADGAEVASLVALPAHGGRQRRVAGAADEQARQEFGHRPTASFRPSGARTLHRAVGANKRSSAPGMLWALRDRRPPLTVDGAVPCPQTPGRIRSGLLSGTSG